MHPLDTSYDGSAPAVCDFCATGQARWSCPATDCDLPHMLGLDDDGQEVFRTPPRRSLGPWAACHRCHAYIQRGDQVGLARAAVSSLPDADSAWAAIALATHSCYWAARTGHPVPWKGHTG